MSKLNDNNPYFDNQYSEENNDYCTEEEPYYESYYDDREITQMHEEYYDYSESIVRSNDDGWFYSDE